MAEESRYTCRDYRMEMILLALQKKLENEDLQEAEKESIRAEIRRVEHQMGMA
ncbi:MAG TPA: hypothetical protein VKO20_04905 [Desulfosalsimonadaceae bacterium]|nr:hypothetical protein [Desulfosalsimonadaceae bacterium]